MEWAYSGQLGSAGQWASGSGQREQWATYTVCFYAYVYMVAWVFVSRVLRNVDLCTADIDYTNRFRVSLRSQLELRLREVAKLGFRRCFVPFIASTALNYSKRSSSASASGSGSGSGSGKVGAPSSPPLVVSGTAVPGSRFFASLPESLSIVPCKTLAEVLAYLPNAASSSSGAPNARGGFARRSSGFAKPASASSSSASSSSMSPSPASLLPPFDESAHEFVLESDLNATDDANRTYSIEPKVL
jgi:hypothetical protein